MSLHLFKKKFTRYFYFSTQDLAGRDGEFSDFPYSSLKDIHKYLKQKLSEEHSELRELGGTLKAEFTNEEIQFIKSISRNNNEFDVSLLKDSYKGMWGAGDLYSLSIDKKNKKIIDFVGEGTLPMPIYINAVSSNDPKFGFFSIYDDLSILDRYFHVYKKGFDENKEEAVQDFIESLTSMDGKVYFSYHSHYFGRVLSSKGRGMYENSYYHIFHIKDQHCYAVSFEVSAQ